MSQDFVGQERFEKLNACDMTDDLLGLFGALLSCRGRAMEIFESGTGKWTQAQRDSAYRVYEDVTANLIRMKPMIYRRLKTAKPWRPSGCE